MKYNEYEKAFSSARLNKYKMACNEFLGYSKTHLFVGLDVLPDSIMNKISKL